MATFDSAVREVRGLVQAQIVATAKAAHADVMATDPRPLNFVRHVDGRQAPEEAVKPGGVIVYDYNRLDLIAYDALELLRKASPVKSGAYVRSHRLFLNLHPVESLRDWKPGDEVSITNTVPYSRVIEVGRRGGKVIKFSMPPHIYERVAQALRREYGATTRIEFTFRAVLDRHQVDQGRTRRRRDHNKADVRWPTIIIHPAGR